MIPVMTEEIICKSLDEIPAIAAHFIEKYEKKRIFAFYGSMGAGKTTFIKALCKELGFNDNVSSPSFGIINNYSFDDTEIYHFDFYRIKNLNEVYDLGYEEYFYSNNYCFIEWPEKVELFLPSDAVIVKIETEGSANIRKFIF